MQIVSVRLCKGGTVMTNGLTICSCVVVPVMPALSSMVPK